MLLVPCTILDCFDYDLNKLYNTIALMVIYIVTFARFNIQYVYYIYKYDWCLSSSVLSNTYIFGNENRIFKCPVNDWKNNCLWNL